VLLDLDHEQAKKELEMLLVQDEADEVVRYWRDKADFETKRRARPDYYRVLNVSTLASEREIRAAYKSRALECHPDKASGNDTSCDAGGGGSSTGNDDGGAAFRLISDALHVIPSHHQ
jgi:hypothetical protein